MTRVLIVDDHALIRRGVQTILHRFPEWQFCGEADNGNDAIRLASELRPEVIIMDVSMPGLNGIEATRVICKTQPKMKIVLLTLHESAELVRNAFRAGARGYLLKTDAEQELVRALTVVIGEGTYISPRIDSEIIKAVIGEMSGVAGSSPNFTQFPVVQPGLPITSDSRGDLSDASLPLHAPAATLV
jgi:DNA-binding NarL/FixJ family response regulator